MASKIEESETKAELMPETIDLSVVEQTTFDEMFDDLMNVMKKSQELQMGMQQMQQALQQNQTEFNGTAKAIGKMIQIKVRTSGFLGDYTYDKEKKCLTRNKNVQK